MLLNIYLLSALGMTLYYNFHPNEVYVKASEDISNVLKLCQKITNGVRAMAFDMSLTLSIAFWTLLRTDYDAVSWHCHLVNSIAVTLDLIVCDHPGK